MLEGKRNGVPWALSRHGVHASRRETEIVVLVETR